MTPGKSGDGARSIRRSSSALFACVALAYFAGAVLSWQSFGADITPAFFPPAGVTVAAMLLTPRSRWSVIVAAIVVAEIGVDLYYGAGVAAASGYAVANSVEPVVGASFGVGVVQGSARPPAAA